MGCAQSTARQTIPAASGTSKGAGNADASQTVSLSTDPVIDVVLTTPDVKHPPPGRWIDITRVLLAVVPFKLRQQLSSMRNPTPSLLTDGTCKVVSFMSHGTPESPFASPFVSPFAPSSHTTLPARPAAASPPEGGVSLRQLPAMEGDPQTAAAAPAQLGSARRAVKNRKLRVGVLKVRRASDWNSLFKLERMDTPMPLMCACRATHTSTTMWWSSPSGLDLLARSSCAWTRQTARCTQSRPSTRKWCALHLHHAAFSAICMRFGIE